MKKSVIIPAIIAVIAATASVFTMTACNTSVAKTATKIAAGPVKRAVKELTQKVTTAPTTAAPTTVAPTTVAPTTVAPTTAAPTTAPATQAPTEAPKKAPVQEKKEKPAQTDAEKVYAAAKEAAPDKETYIGDMGGIVERVSSYKNHRNAIGFSFRFYTTALMKDFDVKLLAVNSVAPTVENIENGSYPLASSFYAVTRSDADENTLALLDWICGEQGQELIRKTGYTPIVTEPGS